MSHNSYELRKQKINFIHSEEMLKLRGQAHYTRDEVEKIEDKWKYKCASWVSGAVLLTTAVMYLIYHP